MNAMKIKSAARKALMAADSRYYTRSPRQAMTNLSEI